MVTKRIKMEKKVKLQYCLNVRIVEPDIIKINGEKN
jgi:hypothetical protein